jgi:hypothetical protein
VAQAANAMIAFAIESGASARKIRLFAVACYRALYPLYEKGFDRTDPIAQANLRKTPEWTAEQRAARREQDPTRQSRRTPALATPPAWPGKRATAGTPGTPATDRAGPVVAQEVGACPRNRCSLAPARSDLGRRPDTHPERTLSLSGQT